MQLVDALAAGIRGAENGTALIYNRIGSQQIAYYQGDGGFEAENQVAAGTPVSLDEHGGATVYVTQVARVVCKNSDGITVRAFTVGNYDAAVEVISPSFTGADYATGASGVSKPVTLEQVLDRWDTSAGAADFKVDIDGVATTLQSALASVVGFFKSVKDPAYGAVGDGVADDTAALTAAMSAVSAAGGGLLYFPEGTYRITSAVTWPQGVNILGSGSDSTTITIDHATANLFASSTGSAAKKWMKDVRLQAAQANTGNLVDFTGASSADFQDVVFGNANCTGTGGLVYASGATTVSATFLRCVFFLNGGLGLRAFSGTVTAAYEHTGKFKDCRFASIAAGRTAGILRGRFLLVDGCTFELGSNDASIPMMEGNGSSGNLSYITATGNRMEDTGSGLPHMVEGDDYVYASIGGNQYGDGCNGLLADEPNGSPTEGAVYNRDRVGKVQYVTQSAAGTLLIDPINHDTVVIAVTTNDNFTVTPDSYMLGCDDLALVLYAAIGGSPSGTISYSGHFQCQTGVSSALYMPTSFSADDHTLTGHFRLLTGPDGEGFYLVGQAGRFT